MSRCPRCDVAMLPDSLAGRSFEACADCGGVWIAGADLGEVTRSAVESLVGVDRRYPDRGLPPPLARPEPLCPSCGGGLAERSFPVAPQVPILACGSCRMLFLRDGQLTALQAALAPDTLPAEAEPVVEFVPEPEVEDTAEPRFAGRWPERVPGQPYLSWAVVGMPLPIAAAVLLLPGIFLSVAMVIATEVPWTWVFAGLAGVYLMWVGQTLGVTIALWITWWLTSGMPMGFGRAYRLMLPVIAVTMAACSLIALPFLVFALPLGAYYLVTFAIRLAMYRGALELEWNEIFVMALVSSLIGIAPGF